MNKSKLALKLAVLFGFILLVGLAVFLLRTIKTPKEQYYLLENEQAKMFNTLQTSQLTQATHDNDWLAVKDVSLNITADLEGMIGINEQIIQLNLNDQQIIKYAERKISAEEVLLKFYQKLSQCAQHKLDGQLTLYTNCESEAVGLGRSAKMAMNDLGLLLVVGKLDETAEKKKK